MRSLVERVAEAAGLTYSDAIRMLVEEALAARAGIPVEHLASDLDAIRFVLAEIESQLTPLENLSDVVDAKYSQVEDVLGQVVTNLQLLNVTTKLWTEALYRDEDTMKEIRNETARILHQLSGWPVMQARQVTAIEQKIERMLNWMAAHDAREQERRYTAMGDDL